MYIIQATDGARTQEKRLNCTESEARKRMQEYFENDYLGLDYFLYDANDGQKVERCRESKFTKYPELYRCAVCHGKFERIF